MISLPNKYPSRLMTEVYNTNPKILDEFILDIGKERKIKDISFIADITKAYRKKFKAPYYRIFISNHFPFDKRNKQYVSLLNSGEIVILLEPFLFKTEVCNYSSSLFMISSGLPIISNGKIIQTVKLYDIEYIATRFFQTDDTKL